MLRAALVLCAVLSAGLSGPADARARDRGDDEFIEGRQERVDDRRNRRDNASDAARRAQMRNGGGRVLSVEPFGAGYRVKVLKDGVVRVYVIEDK